MNKLFILCAVLAICVIYTTSIYIDEIGPAPEKTTYRPFARYSVRKNKLRVSQEDFPSDSFKLIELINSYREESGVPTIRISPSLMYVAQAHATDLSSKIELEKDPQCGLYSWSQSPRWQGCCSNSTNFCMDKKPAEIVSSYQIAGYELVFVTNYTIRSEFLSNVLSAWKESKGHNDVLLNNNTWSSETWRAIGVGINSGVVTLWFGARADSIAWVTAQNEVPSKSSFFPTQPSTSNPEHSSGDAPTQPNNWFPTQPSNWFPTQPNTRYPTQPNTWRPTQSNYWYPTQPSNWYPTQPNNWYPTQPNNWYPTQPSNWYPTQPSTWDYPNQNEEQFKVVLRARNHVYEMWLVILSVVVFALFLSFIVMIRVVKAQREQIKALLSFQSTSCAIPEKF